MRPSAAEQRGRGACTSCDALRNQDDDDSKCTVCKPAVAYRRRVTRLLVVRCGVAL